MSEPWQRRGVCPECEDYVCLDHGGHVGERCDCSPCDDCRDLADDLDERGLCRNCRERVAA